MSDPLIKHHLELIETLAERRVIGRAIRSHLKARIRFLAFTFNRSMHVMKVLVSGGAGFIGSHVVDLFVRNGYDSSFR